MVKKTDLPFAAHHSRKPLLLQRVEQLLEAAGAGRADAAFARAERGGDVGVGRGLGGVEEHLEERAAAFAQLALPLALLGRERPQRLRAPDRAPRLALGRRDEPRLEARGLLDGLDAF